MKKQLSLVVMSCASLLSLPGCLPMVGAGAAGGIYETRGSKPPPADTADQIPPHESWCYSTMGEQIECFAHPQATPPGRLVNVDPPNLYPLDAKAYQKALAKSQAEQNQADNPPALQPDAVQPAVEQPIILPPEAMPTLSPVNGQGASLPPPVQPADMSPMSIRP